MTANNNDNEDRMTLRLCSSFDELDAILSQMGYDTYLEKISYLKKLFDIEIVHASENDTRTDYIAIANAVIHYW